LVIFEGISVQLCIYPVSAVEGANVQTIEGLQDDLAETIREAWVANTASQCGYCQPGQLMAAYALLTENPQPTDEDIDNSMRNLCRCGTYPRVRQAIHDAADAIKGGMP
jgi:isoquinoline 1-oxidoreductase alpha subunit